VNQVIRRWTFEGNRTIVLVDPGLPEPPPEPAPGLSFRDQLLAHLSPEPNQFGTRLKTIRATAAKALPILFPENAPK